MIDVISRSGNVEGGKMRKIFIITGQILGLLFCIALLIFGLVKFGEHLDNVKQAQKEKQIQAEKQEAAKEAAMTGPQKRERLARALDVAHKLNDKDSSVLCLDFKKNLATNKYWFSCPCWLLMAMYIEWQITENF